MIPSGSARPRFTLDTNLLVSSVDRSVRTKHDSAMQIVARAPDFDCRLTLQSLSEFYAVVTRKGLVPAAEAAAQVTDWLSFFNCAVQSDAAIRTALADAVAGRASYWDALLIATAAEAGCRLILTEDMSDGTMLGSVEIHNPFAAGGGLTERTRELLGL